MTAGGERTATIPPRLFVRSASVLHRALYRFTGGRIGLRPPGAGARFGTMRLKAEPAWWLNLQAQPDTTVELSDGPRAVRGRAAAGEEADRPWARWGEFSDQYDAWAAMRSGKTAVVVLEPRIAAGTTT
jgi:hypothetical protein